jgi:hypothetical protein
VHLMIRVSTDHYRIQVFPTAIALLRRPPPSAL